MPFYPMRCLQPYVGSSFSGQVCMSLALVATELVREARFWFSPGTATCPWGAIAFLLLLTFLIGACCGGCLVGCLLSAGCQRVGLLAARLLAGLLAPQPVSLRGRLAEYQRRDS